MNGIIKNNLKILKKNFPFLLSGIMLVILFSQPSKFMLLISLAITGTIFIVSFCKSNISLVGKQKKTCTKFYYILSLIIVALGFYSFYKSWGSSGVVLSITDKLNISPETLVPLIAFVLAVLAYYGTYYLLYIVIDEIKYLANEFLVMDKSKILSNTVKNLPVFFSFVALLTLYMVNDTMGIIAMILAVIIAFIFLSQTDSIFEKVKSVNIVYKFIAIVTSLGVTMYLILTQNDNLIEFSLFITKSLHLTIDKGITYTVINLVLAFVSAFFVFSATALLYNYLGKKLKSVFADLTKFEYIIYTLLIALVLGFVTYSFLNTQVFYKTDYICDIIYTSDSQMLVKNNVYMNLTYAENDIRQPLFAVFATPFAGFGYALSLIFSSVECSYALFMNLVQIVLMILSNLMLAKLLKLSSYERVGFMILSSITYTTLLFSLMMEQYIIAYFWAIFAVYQYCQEKASDSFTIAAASGSLLTSLVLAPIASQHLTLKDITNSKIKAFIRDMEKSVLAFVFFFLAFARVSMTNNFDTLMRFTGENISIQHRVLQYFSFISDCFIKPDTVTGFADTKNPIWKLNDITTLSIVGVAVFVLAILGFIVTRKNKLSLIAMYWVMFSVVILLVVGWGSSENGMILYALYFSWAFLVLIYQLVLAIAKKFNIKAITFVLSVIAIVVLAIINIPAIYDLLQFGILNYPV